MSPTRTVFVVAANLARFAAVAPVSVALEASASAVQVPAPKGIDLKELDLTADPCTDFDAFANGAWRAANPIPAGAQRWSRRTAAREANRRAVEGPAGGNGREGGSAPWKRRAAARRPLRGVHGRDGDRRRGRDPARRRYWPTSPAVQDAAGVQRMIRRLHELAVPAPFVVTGASDYHDPASVVVNIAAGGLGLPDRDSYLKPDARFAQARETYRAHVASVLTLGGVAAAPARKAAGEILALETRLAEASLAPAAAADPAATAHKLTFAQLSQRANRFDWESYFKEAGLPAGLCQRRPSRRS